MDVFAIIAGVSLVILLYVWCDRSRKRSNYPPGRRGLPIIGNWEITQRNARNLRDFGAICSLKLFGKNFILINDWKILKEALIQQGDIFSGRPRTFITVTLNRGKDLIFIDGPVLKEKRRMAIHALRDLGLGKTSMQDAILDELSKVQNILDNSNGRPLEITGLFFIPTLNISWGLITGKKYQYDDPFIIRLAYLVKTRMELNSSTSPVNALPLLRFLPKDPFNFWKLMDISKEIMHFINVQVDEHMATFQPESEPRDLVDAYLVEIHKRNISMENNNEETAPYNREHLIGTMTSFLIAGIDTISSTLEWTFLYMAIWPEIQRKVQEELDNVIGHDRLIQYTDASRLPYTEATLLEIQRYEPTVPLGVPHRTTSATKLASYTVPKDETILTNLWAIHHDKQLWGDPEVFRPERFLSAEGKTVKPEHWVPFSIGSRSCPGVPLARIQLFLFFTSLLQRFTFSCITGEAPPSLDPLTHLSNTVTPKTFRLIINKR